MIYVLFHVLFYVLFHVLFLWAGLGRAGLGWAGLGWASATSGGAVHHTGLKAKKEPQLQAMFGEMLHK